MARAIATSIANWKTTAAAIGMLLVAGIPVLQALTNGERPDWNIFIQEIIAAIGLLFARDANKTSEQSGAKP